jgi:hypothetical protein
MLRSDITKVLRKWRAAIGPGLGILLCAAGLVLAVLVASPQAFAQAKPARKAAQQIQAIPAFWKRR